MRIITIDDKKYGIRLPYGGRSEADRNNEWDRAIDAGCQLDWESRYSWCLERVGVPYRVIRGGNTDRHWGSIVSSYCGPSIGFRPVLVPLNPSTMEPDYSLYAGRDGQTIELGTFAYDHNSNIVIDDTSWGIDTGRTVEWAIFDGKLISTRVLETDITWNDLDKMGFCTLDIFYGPEREPAPMSSVGFARWLDSEFAKYPILAKSNPHSLNELVYVLRMSGKDFNLSWQTADGAAIIPSIRETFIPSRDLAQKVRVEDYAEEEMDGVTHRFITVEIIKE